jgi:ABC-2 type transport system permease protein
MNQYIRVYKELIRINFRYLVEYRANLFNYALSSIVWTLFSFVSIFLLTQQTTELFGLKREELWLMTTLYSVLVGIFHLFFSKNFERFSDLIYLGQLDSLLTKPLDSQFLVSFWRINFATMFRLLSGVIGSVWIVVTYHIPITATALIFGILLIPISVSILYSIWLLVTTCIVWSPRMSNLVEILYTITGMTRYPKNMYEQTLGNFVIAIFPIIVLITIPVHTLLGLVTAVEIGQLIFLAIALNLIARYFFLYSLRFYTGASA